jgi:hypothetical protein
VFSLREEQVGVHIYKTATQERAEQGIYQGVSGEIALARAAGS